MRQETSIFRNIRHFLRVVFFVFWIRNVPCVSIKEYESRKFHFWKYKKFFNIGAGKLHLLKYKEYFRREFLYIFLYLELKSGPGSPTYYYY